MKTKAEWKEDIRIAVKLERNFWQLVVILSFFFGLLLGGGLVRCGIYSAGRGGVDVASMLRVQMLEAEVKRCRK